MLRVDVAVVFPNGTVAHQIIPVTNLTIPLLNDKMIGVWDGGSEGIEISFQVSLDVNEVKVYEKSPYLRRDTIHLSGIRKPSSFSLLWKSSLYQLEKKSFLTQN
jgi:hypothetical protein